MEQQYQAIEQAIRVAAKTGLFFACVDGDYSPAEKQFMDNYLARLAQLGPVEDLNGMLDHVMDHPITMPEIVSDTRQMLSLLPSPADRQAVLSALSTYVQRVIAVDGVVQPTEREALARWYDAIAY